MIYNALLAPREHPPTLLEVKRALLTFQKIVVISPHDRDLFPPNAWMLAMGLPPIVAFPVGAVRPLGKAPNYDEQFSRLEEALKDPIRQGLVEVISTYDQHATQHFTLGAVPLGGYPIHPNPLLWLYRTAAQTQTHLRSVLDEEILGQLDNPSLLAALSEKGVADGGINDSPALPLLDNDLPTEKLREPLTVVARARVAVVIKTMGYCEAKSLVPLMTTPGYVRFAGSLLQNTKTLLTAFGNEQPDPFWLQINRVLDAMHRELIDDAALDALSVGDVGRLRTRAWGEQAKARENLFTSIQRIAEETSSAEDKTEAIDGLVREYKKKAAELERERAAIKYKVIFDAVAASASSIASGALAQLVSPLGAALTLVAGLVWFRQRCTKYGPELVKWREKRNEFAKSAGYALTSFSSAVNSKLK